MKRKCYVLVNSENIVKPEQLMTSKVGFISLKNSKLQICFVLNVFNDKMWSTLSHLVRLVFRIDL